MPNSITITGRLGRDSETRYAPSGTAILSFTVGCDTGFGDHKKTVWFACAIFGKRAEGRLSEFLVKGQEVTVFGELREIRTYEKQNGETGTSAEIAVNEVALHGGGDSGGHASRSAERRESNQRAQTRRPAQTRQPEQTQQEFDDDIPF